LWAAAPVADRLSADKRTTVCLIEAGGDNQHVTVRVPLLLIANVPKKNGFNWAFDTVPQKGLNGRVGYQPRGKGMGGSSAINALVYMRGHPGDYDEWEARAGATATCCRCFASPRTTRSSATSSTARAAS
jgi:choline dehydrogenase-like flavoprotein